MGFPKNVATNPALGVPGDRASQNPLYNYDAGPGALVAGVDGVSVGLFAWVANDSNGQPDSVSNSGSGVPQGFMSREQQALLTDYLQESGMLIPAGFEVTLHNGGDFLVKNETGGAVAVGAAVYTNVTNGKAVASGGGAVDTGWKYASAGANGATVKIRRLP